MHLASAFHDIRTISLFHDCYMMAETLIERSCQRFRQEIAPEDDRLFQTVSLEDVRCVIREVDLQLAARQGRRNLNRLNPFLDAMERYSKAIDVLSNAVPCLPYAWVLASHFPISIFYQDKC